MAYSKETDAGGTPNFLLAVRFYPLVPSFDLPIDQQGRFLGDLVVLVSPLGLGDPLALLALLVLGDLLVLAALLVLGDLLVLANRLVLAVPLVLADPPLLLGP